MGNVLIARAYGSELLGGIVVGVREGVGRTRFFRVRNYFDDPVYQELAVVGTSSVLAVGAGLVSVSGMALGVWVVSESVAFLC